MPITFKKGDRARRLATRFDEDSEDGYPCRLALTLVISDDRITLDFTGSDPQIDELRASAASHSSDMCMAKKILKHESKQML